MSAKSSEMPRLSLVFVLLSFLLLFLPWPWYHFGTTALQSIAYAQSQAPIDGNIPCGQQLTISNVSYLAGTPDFEDTAAGNVIDNNFGTRAAIEGREAIILIDLGEKRQVCSLDIAWYKGDSRVQTFSVAWSDSADSFPSIQREDFVSSGTTTGFENYLLPVGAAGRYLWIIGDHNTDNNWLSITEVKVNGSVITPEASAQTENSTGSNFTGSTFSNASIQVNGDAQIIDNLLRLTPSLDRQSASAWFTTKQPVMNGFNTTFTFQITKLGGVGDSCISGHTGGDGIAFVIQNAPDGETAIGGLDEGGIGYIGIPNSVAIELDTFCNPTTQDHNDNHISIHTNGQVANSASEQFSKAMSILPVDISDGAVHTLEISYIPNNMRISIDGNAIMLAPLNLGELLSLEGEDGLAYIGFTSTTGAAHENHDIKSWSFVPSR